MGDKESLDQCGKKTRFEKKSCSIRQNSLKKTDYFCAGILHALIVKVFNSETTSFHYVSPKDSESLKFLDIQLWEVGAKRHSNGTSKVNRRTDTRTDILTFRKNRPTEPIH